MTSMSQHYPTMTTSWHQDEAQTQPAQSPSYHLQHMNTSTHSLHHNQQQHLQISLSSQQQGHLVSPAEHHEHATSSSSSYSLLDSTLAVDSLSPTNSNGANMQSSNLYDFSTASSIATKTPTTSTSSTSGHVTSSKQQSNPITAAEKSPLRTNSQPSSMCHHNHLRQQQQQQEFDYPSTAAVMHQQTSPSVITAGSTAVASPYQSHQQIQQSGWAAAQSTSPQIASTSPAISTNHRRFHVDGSPHLQPSAIGATTATATGHVSPYSPNGYLSHHHHHNNNHHHHQQQQQPGMVETPTHSPQLQNHHSQDVSQLSYQPHFVPHYQPLAHHNHQQHHPHNPQHHQQQQSQHQLMQSQTAMQLNSPVPSEDIYTGQHVHSAPSSLPLHQQQTLPQPIQIQAHHQHHHHQLHNPHIQYHHHHQQQQQHVNQHHQQAQLHQTSPHLHHHHQHQDQSPLNQHHHQHHHQQQHHSSAVQLGTAHHHLQATSYGQMHSINQQHQQQQHQHHPHQQQLIRANSAVTYSMGQSAAYTSNAASSRHQQPSSEHYVGHMSAIKKYHHQLAHKISNNNSTGREQPINSNTDQVHPTPHSSSTASTSSPTIMSSAIVTSPAVQPVSSASTTTSSSALNKQFDVSQRESIGTGGLSGGAESGTNIGSELKSTTMTKIENPQLAAKSLAQKTPANSISFNGSSANISQKDNSTVGRDDLIKESQLSQLHQQCAVLLDEQQQLVAASISSPTNSDNNNNNNNGTTDASNNNNSNSSGNGNLNSTSNGNSTTTSRSKRLRTSFKHNQLKEMKKWFGSNQNPDAKDLKTLSQRTGLSKRVLQVWFQNARAKYRRNSAKANQQMYDVNQHTSHILQLQQHHQQTYLHHPHMHHHQTYQHHQQRQQNLVEEKQQQQPETLVIEDNQLDKNG